MQNSPLIDYTLYLADNALILGHRNSEWCGHGPVLEQDIAITNISLDLIGQARSLYQYAASLLGDDHTEDSLASLRDATDFKNIVMVELPKGDWAITILRQFFFSQYQFILYSHLLKGDHSQLSAIGEKSLKEVTYHVRWSSEWVIRLGDGTEESNQRMLAAIKLLSPYIMEMFEPAPYEVEVNADPSTFYDQWKEKVESILSQATLSMPLTNSTSNSAGNAVAPQSSFDSSTPYSSENDSTLSTSLNNSITSSLENHSTSLLLNKLSSSDPDPTMSRGKSGKHTSYLQDILNDLQYMQRTYPGASW